MSEVFGESDYIIRVKLDELERGLDEAERKVIMQQERVGRAQAEAVANVRTAGEAGSKAIGALLTVGKAVAVWKLLPPVIKLVAARLLAIPAVALSVKAALLGLVVTVVGGLGELNAQFWRSMRNVRRAMDGLDGSTQRARELAEALREIPIAGRAAAFGFKVFSGDMILADEALTSLIATVEDGQVKIGMLARIAARTTDAFGSVVGVDLGFGRYIDETDDLNEKMVEMRGNLAAVSRLSEFTNDQAGRLGGRTLEDSRSAELEGLEGLERVRVENRIRHEEAMRFFELERVALNKKLSEELDGVTKRQQAGELGERQARLAREGLQVIAERQRQSINQKEAEALQSVNELSQKRIALEKQLQEAANRRASAVTRSIELDASGDHLGARLVMIEHRRQEAITDAIQRGKRDRIELIQQEYDARVRMARQAHEEEARAQQESMEQAMRAIREQANQRAIGRLSTLGGLHHQTLAAEARLQGRDFDARREGVHGAFRDRLVQARADGDERLIEALERLRDVQLAQIDQDEREKQIKDAEQAQRDRERELASTENARAMQIDLARDLPGFGQDITPGERKIIEKLDELVEKADDGRVAVAG